MFAIPFQRANILQFNISDATDQPSLKQKGSDMKLSHCLLLPAVLLSFALPASADTVSGTIVNHNDVVQIPITVATETDITIFTNSFASGGFDPILTLWYGGILIGENDDAPTPVHPSQAYLDSALQLAGLAPGSYLLTVTSFNNFANGNLLSEGFRHDGAEPTPIEQWWTQGGGHYNVHWTFGPVSSIPEPSSVMMLFAGLCIAAFARRR